ncbi:MAG: hypothetical protein DYG94_11500 [Leptolyngbya sp. PLA3]|nr:MAG: hypothetical protein EDM82_11640 [Cyanobacteria bacterium CYA]MCE7969350.1 hypothetical protein [Leptolyngbya sp. PL-A3]
MTEPLRELLGRFELQNAGPITAQEARRWGRGFVARLSELGVLREATPAASIRNEACEHACDMEPEVVTHAVTGERFGIHRCVREECGVVRVPLDDLRRWECDLVGFAGAVGRAVDAGGQIVVDVPGRLIEVGRIIAGDSWRDVFLARGLAWDDAATALADARRLKASDAPLVLALGKLPSTGVWPDCHPAVALLSDIVSLNGGGMAVDCTGVIGRHTKPHPSAIESKWITVTEAGEMLLSDVSGITLKQAMARVSRAGTAGKFTTNGKERQARRIDRASFSTWRLEQREKDLAECD